MNSLMNVIVAGYLIVMTSSMQQVSAQAGTNLYYPELTRYSAANTCNEKLILPLTSILFPLNNTWSYMCGPTYFDTCRAEFSARCSVTNCSASINEYMRWIDSVSIPGSQYTCGIGINKIIEISLNGGQTCITSHKGVLRQVMALDDYLWTADRPVTCLEMESLIKSVYTAIKSCEVPELLYVINGYFKAVINSSPCKEMGTGAANQLTIPTFLLFIIYPLHLYIR